jgi:hypothetical protein
MSIGLIKSTAPTKVIFAFAGVETKHHQKTERNSIILDEIINNRVTCL